MRPSSSSSQRQLSTPAAAEAMAPPVRVAAMVTPSRGQPAVRAMPPMVVASKRGMSLGLATSSQAGSLTEGRTEAGAATIEGSLLPLARGLGDRVGTLTMGHLQ